MFLWSWLPVAHKERQAEQRHLRSFDPLTPPPLMVSSAPSPAHLPPGHERCTEANAPWHVLGMQQCWQGEGCQCLSHHRGCLSVHVSPALPQEVLVAQPAPSQALPSAPSQFPERRPLAEQGLPQRLPSTPPREKAAAAQGVARGGSFCTAAKGGEEGVEGVWGGLSHSKALSRPGPQAVCARNNPGRGLELFCCLTALHVRPEYAGWGHKNRSVSSHDP